MTVPRSGPRQLRRADSDGGTSTSTFSSRGFRITQRPRAAWRLGRSVSPFLSLFLGSLLVGGLSTGALAQVRWGDRGLELSPEAAAVIGVVLFGGIATAFFSLTGHQSDDAGDEPNDEPAAPPSIVTGEETERAQVAAVQDDDGDWQWRVVHLEAVAESETGVDTRSAATDRIDRLQTAIDTATLREVPDAAVRLYEDRDGTWQWTLVRDDGRRVGTAAGGYDDRDAAEAAVSVLKDRGPDADVIDVEAAAVTITERGDRWYWNLVDDERTPLAAGTDGYDDRGEAEAAAEAFLERVGQARVLDVDHVGIELYESAADGESDADESWTWRVLETVDDVVADATVAFETRPAGEDAARTVLEALDEAAITVAGKPAYERYQGRSQDQVRGRQQGQNSGQDQDRNRDQNRDQDRDQEQNPGPDRNRKQELDDAPWNWRLVDAGGRVVARSPDGIPDQDTAVRATELFSETAPDADVLEIDEAVYEVAPVTDRDRQYTAAGDPYTAASTTETAAADATETTTVTDGAGVASGVDTTTGADESGERTDRDEDAEPGRDAGTDSNPDTDTDGDAWHWRLVTDDRDVIARSADRYADSETATTAIERLREQAHEADRVTFETAAFRVYETDTGEWRWRLLDEGGTVLADSDAAHDSRNEAIEAMLTLKERAPDADVVEIDTAAFELYAVDDEWSWRLIDDAGRRIAAAPTTYPSHDAARAAVDRLDDLLDADDHTMDRAAFQPYVDAETQEWHWRFVRPSGEPLAVSATGYATRDELRERLDEVRETAATERAYTTGAITVQLAGNETWQWRLLDRDRTPIVESTAAYADREAARSAVERLAETGTDAPIFTLEDGAIWLEEDDSDSDSDSDGDAANAAGSDDADGWGWEFVDSDRERLATAADTDSKSAVTATIDEMQTLAPLAERVIVDGASFDIVTRERAGTGERDDETGSNDDSWRWRLLDEENRPLGHGANGADSKAAARESIADVRRLLERASVIELEGAAFELYRVDDEAWAWRLVDEYGETVLESVRTYETRAAAQDAIATLQEHVPDGRVTVAD